MTQLNNHQQAKLDAAAAAQNNLQAAKQHRVTAFRDAVEEGVPMATISRHAGIARSAVWHIINRAEKKKE